MKVNDSEVSTLPRQDVSLEEVVADVVGTSNELGEENAPLIDEDYSDVDDTVVDYENQQEGILSDDYDSDMDL